MMWVAIVIHCKSQDKQTEFLSAGLKDAFAAESYTLYVYVYTVAALRSYSKGILNTK